MGQNDLYEVVSNGVLQNQDVDNVWHYLAIASNTDALDLATRFQTQVLTPLVAFQSDQISYVSVACRNLFDDFDEDEIASSLVGALANQSLPSFNSLSVELVASTGIVNDGRKALGGFSEDNQTDGQWNATFLSSIDTWGVDDYLPGVVGAGAEGVKYVPVIIKRIKYTTPSGNTAYRLPADSLEAVSTSVSSIVTKPFVASQLSRKGSPATGE